MNKINWGRVVIGAILTGAVWGTLYAIVLPLVGQEFLRALPGTNQPGQHFPGATPAMRVVALMMPFALGLSTMWLYAAIRPRYGAGPKTALVAGLAMWFVGSWIDAFWSALGAISFTALVGPVIANLPVMLLAAFAGAWTYKE